jgi:hypothetical protein
MRIFVKDFCNSVGIKLNKHRHMNHALIVVIDDRERTRAEFIIPRKVLPKDTRPGDKVEFVKD